MSNDLIQMTVASSHFNEILNERLNANLDDRRSAYSSCRPQMIGGPQLHPRSRRAQNPSSPLSVLLAHCPFVLAAVMWWGKPRQGFDLGYLGATDQNSGTAGDNSEFSASAVDSAKN